MGRLSGQFTVPFPGQSSWMGGTSDSTTEEPGSGPFSGMVSSSSFPSRMKLLPIFRKKQIVSRGNAIATPDFIELSVPGFTNILPHAEELTLITLSEYHQTDLRWGIYFTSGFDRNNETTTVANAHLLGTLLSASSPIRHSAYTTLADFLHESRLFLGIGNANVNTGSLSATAGAALLVKTVGQ